MVSETEFYDIGSGLLFDGCPAQYLAPNGGRRRRFAAEEKEISEMCKKVSGSIDPAFNERDVQRICNFDQRFNKQILDDLKSAVESHNRFYESDIKNFGSREKQ